MSLSFFLFAPLLWGQMEAGRISGAVTDSSGARVRKAQVSLENPLSGRKSQTQSDDQGQFEFDNVPYGSYAMRVSALGFNSSTVQVSVGSNVPVRIPVQLEIAGTKSDITVAAPGVLHRAPPRQKSSSTKITSSLRQPWYGATNYSRWFQPLRAGIPKTMD